MTNIPDVAVPVTAEPTDDLVEDLAEQVAAHGPLEGAQLLEAHADEVIVRVLQAVNPSTVQDVLDELSPGYTNQRLEALVSRLRRKMLGNGGLKLGLVSEYGQGYAFNEHVQIV